MSTKVEYILSLRDLLSGKLDAANASAQRLGNTVSSISGGLTRLAATAGIALGGAAIVNGLKSIVDAGSKVENATTGLTTMLKDSSAAAQVVQNTMEDATKTPFAFESLLAANKALISANVNAKDARQTVLDLSNAIAATGGGDVELERMVVNLQQIKNVGKATAMDIKQFAIAGVNIYEVLAKATGKPIAAVKEMDVSYNMLTAALKKAHDEGGLYANGLENMAGNTSVRVSNLGDAIFQLKVKMFNDLKPAIDTIITGMADMIEWLRGAWEWSVKNREMIAGLAKGILFGVAAWKAYTLAVKASVIWTRIQYASITLLGDGFMKAGVATKFFAGTFQLLKTALLSNPITAVLVAITGLTTAYLAFSGSAKDAARENDSLNKSLYETMTQASETETAWVKQMMDVVNQEKLPAKRKASMMAFLKDEEQQILSGMASTQAKIKNLTVGTKGERLFLLEEDKNELKGLNKEAADLSSRMGVLSSFKRNNFRLPGQERETGNPLDVTTQKKETAKATGNKSVHIEVHINNLINDFTVKVTNMMEGAGKAKEFVTQALLSAVNDSQIIAGQ